MDARTGERIWMYLPLAIYEPKNCCGRYYLVDERDGTLLHELISGEYGLKKYYSGSELVYAQKILNKNLKSRLKEISYFEEQIEIQQKRADYINFLLEKITRIK